MQVYYNGMSEFPRGTGIGLGNFDGIHLGHSALIDTLTEKCRDLNLHSMIYTFRNHPDTLLFKDKYTPVILNEKQKIEILRQKGIDILYFEDFNESYSRLSPEEFVKKILVDKFNVKMAVIGYDYTFGCLGKGNAEDMKRLGEIYGFMVEVIPPVKMLYGRTEVEISSTLLRQFISEGDMEGFYRFTGRYYSILGQVREGRMVGRSLGFPTANIIPDNGYALPSAGVYATQTMLWGRMHTRAVSGGNDQGRMHTRAVSGGNDQGRMHTRAVSGGNDQGRIFNSVTNIGNNPTFGLKQTTVETHIFDFEGKLYGSIIEVFFRKKMRSEVKFTDEKQLIEQIKNDIVSAKNYFL
ncbi:MAG: bifunctional riboflavin kinase/FMN adenylyltransferase [Clostridiales bacterium]|jgi:riboflavin kinase/FMN adenylyltransferase|nr:bifunctional riboflavin kinase/FMN adenylyltransferase [Clostridiales bacterium]